MTGWLAGCGASAEKSLTNATLFPATGPDAALGQAMQRGVDLAARQNVALGQGWTLSVAHVDTASTDTASAISGLAADSQVVGIVGPLDSQTAVDMLPTVAQQSLVTISPSATLPGLTQSDAAKAEGLSFTTLHSEGKPVAFFRLPRTDAALGKAAADVAISPTSAHGLGAHSVYLVDDGSASAKALAAAFAQQLKARGGSVAGQHTLALDSSVAAQQTVSAIVEAYPDAVFYAGVTAGGAAIRSTLSLSGAPMIPLLAAGTIAGNPGWGAAVGVTVAATNTTALLPAQDLSALKDAKSFVTAYQDAYPKQDLVAQSALAYDAAMDEIAAIKSLIAAGKPVTRAAVLAAVASAKYQGVTGTLAFDKNGDNTAAPAISIYTCDNKGVWHYQAAVGG
jgi:branched-chain amino acid transport system substrate-binding protein